MDYEVSDSSGTDDDIPQTHQSGYHKGSRIVGNGRSALGTSLYSRMHTDMEAQIHHLEQEAYSAVLRAFKAQSDAITWEKESLITELRKELRVSDDEHRELLTKVNGDDIIRRIREWRQAGELQTPRYGATQPVHDVLPSPTVSASRKKQKTSQTSQHLPGLSSMQYHSTGSTGTRHLINRSSFGAHVANHPPEGTTYDPLIGRKVWTRWPEDNNFYQAVVTDYNPAEGRHALVYDIGTANETWEWVDFKEISPEDIRWESEDPGTYHRGGLGGPGRGIRIPMNRGAFIQGTGRGRGPTKGQSRREITSMQNGFAKTFLDDIELLNTDTLVKEVEKVFILSHPDPIELEKAKKMLKDHEQALVAAIAKLAEASDGESDGEQPFLHTQAMEHE
ncbi:hypothetical protein K2173_024211 [Erythroxylum novogranatense]|uniref:ENT domain-containing protein n=1 Tax=Erythroxylum novogranatense TaxID=1862640 RepID=A0AAV8UCD6_9ROSI|nr:hypothetical protein K2173_024211 [Erythroxylum novogranatense]